MLRYSAVYCRVMFVRCPAIFPPGIFRRGLFKQTLKIGQGETAFPNIVRYRLGAGGSYARMSK